MKFLMSVFFIIFFTGCLKSESTKSISCTYNEKPIDCQLLDGKGDLKSQDNDELPDYLIVTGEVPIRIFDHYFEYSENKEFVNKFQGSRSSFECSFEVSSGQQIRYEVNQKELTLLSNESEDVIKMPRVKDSYSDVKNLLIGKFEKKIKINGELKPLFEVSFGLESIIISQYCYLDKK